MHAVHILHSRMAELVAMLRGTKSPGWGMLSDCEQSNE
jgi:hypothetical protein